MSASDVDTEFDLIAVGDTTQDIFLKMEDASVQCDLDGENCKICFDYADKISVSSKTDIPAVGNAANNAIGAARLGLRSAIYTVVGDDAQGHRAKDVFEESAVDTRYVAFDKEHGTNLSVVINFRGERTIFVYHEPRTYALPAFVPTTWMYLTSASGDGVLQLHEQVLAYLDQYPKVKLAFNPGTHQIHLGHMRLLPLLHRTELLFVNREEGAGVLEIRSRDVKKLVHAFHRIGVKTIVLTDGPDGSYVSDGTQIKYLRIFRGPVVERTGAGDAYGSGFLSALIKGKSLAEAMLWGNANSTSVVQYIGARAGLLTEEAMLKIIKENEDIKVENFS